MKLIRSLMCRLKFTPILLYTVLLIIDNLLYLPIGREVIGNFNQGALGNIVSLFMIALSIIGLFIERYYIIYGHAYNKKTILVELVLIFMFTLFWWFFITSPFPTLRILFA
jgi:hypothetical protein